MKVCVCIYQLLPNPTEGGMEVLGSLPACPLVSEPLEFPAEMWLGRWQLAGADVALGDARIALSDVQDCVHIYAFRSQKYVLYLCDVFSCR